MVTIYRLWSRSVKYLVNLPQHSVELVATVIEFGDVLESNQQPYGNLPHYHILIWTK